MNKNQRNWLLLFFAVLMLFNNVGGPVVLDLDWVTLSFSNLGAFLVFYMYYRMLN